MSRRMRPVTLRRRTSTLAIRGYGSIDVDRPPRVQDAQHHDLSPLEQEAGGDVRRGGFPTGDRSLDHRANGQMTSDTNVYATLSQPKVRPTCAIIIPRLSEVLMTRRIACRANRIARMANRRVAQSRIVTSRSNCGARLAITYSATSASSAVPPMMTETRASRLSAGVVEGSGGPHAYTSVVEGGSAASRADFRRSLSQYGHTIAPARNISLHDGQGNRPWAEGTCPEEVALRSLGSSMALVSVEGDACLRRPLGRSVSGTSYDGRARLRDLVGPATSRRAEKAP